MKKYLDLVVTVSIIIAIVFATIKVVVGVIQGFQAGIGNGIFELFFVLPISWLFWWILGMTIILPVCFLVLAIPHLIIRTIIK